MEFLPGFKLDFWDFATAVVLFMRVITGLAFVIWLAGQPAALPSPANTPMPRR